MYAHWQKLFGTSIKPYQSVADRDGEGLFLQQLLDNRMPAMSFIAVDDPGSIHPDDEDRLPAFDPPGLDYDPQFRTSLRDSFRYTRFRHRGTAYYCNGTSFAMVCDSGEYKDLLLMHFKRHYTHLAVIAQYQHAALLYFADELADSAKSLARSDGEASDSKWRDRIRKVQHRFLNFRTRCYFTEVSNQIQGKDLFRLWFDHLGTQDLFERVSQTSSEVYEAQENHEIKELTKAQKNLAVIATIGLPMSIVLTWAALFPEAVREDFRVTGSTIIGGPWIWLVIASLVAVVFWKVWGSQLGLNRNRMT